MRARRKERSSLQSDQCIQASSMSRIRDSLSMLSAGAVIPRPVSVADQKIPLEEQVLQAGVVFAAQSPLYCFSMTRRQRGMRSIVGMRRSPGPVRQASFRGKADLSGSASADPSRPAPRDSLDGSRDPPVAGERRSNDRLTQVRPSPMCRNSACGQHRPSHRNGRWRRQAIDVLSECQSTAYRYLRTRPGRATVARLSRQR